jgi:hypothetical protein
MGIVAGKTLWDRLAEEKRGRGEKEFAGICDDNVSRPFSPFPLCSILHSRLPLSAISLLPSRRDANR